MPTQRYLVGPGEEGDITKIVAVLKRDRGIKIVKTLGPTNNPNIVVVEMTTGKANTLKKRYAGRFIIEPDAPLTPSDGEGLSRKEV